MQDLRPFIPETDLKYAFYSTKISRRKVPDQKAKDRGFRFLDAKLDQTFNTGGYRRTVAEAAEAAQRRVDNNINEAREYLQKSKAIHTEMLKREESWKARTGKSSQQQDVRTLSKDESVSPSAAHAEAVRWGGGWVYHKDRADVSNKRASRELKYCYPKDPRDPFIPRSNAHPSSGMVNNTSIVLGTDNDKSRFLTHNSNYGLGRSTNHLNNLNPETSHVLTGIKIGRLDISNRELCRHNGDLGAGLPSIFEVVKNIQNQLSQTVVGLGKNAIQRVFNVDKSVSSDSNLRIVDRMHFRKSMARYQVILSNAQLDSIFNTLDPKNTGRISLDVFLSKYVGDMSRIRNSAVDEVFAKFGVTEIDFNKMKEYFNHARHEIVQNSRLEEKQEAIDYAERLFIKKWMAILNGRQFVKSQDFRDYYCDISHGIENDQEFFDVLLSDWNFVMPSSNTNTLVDSAINREDLFQQQQQQLQRLQQHVQQQQYKSKYPKNGFEQQRLQIQTVLDMPKSSINRSPTREEIFADLRDRPMMELERKRASDFPPNRRMNRDSRIDPVTFRPQLRHGTDIRIEKPPSREATRQNFLCRNNSKSPTRFNRVSNPEIVTDTNVLTNGVGRRYREKHLFLKNTTRQTIGVSPKGGSDFKPGGVYGSHGVSESDHYARLLHSDNCDRNEIRPIQF